jgi:acyl-CoA-binding protein
MSDLKSKFEAAAEAVKQLPEKPDNDMLLRLYAAFKQATEGDVSGPQPSLFDFKGKAKYDAWEKLKGTGSEDAMKKYCDLVKRLGGKF